MMIMDKSMWLLFLSLLLVHVAFDFYFQSESMVENKSFKHGWKKAFQANIKHAFLHGSFSLLVCIAFIYSFLSDYCVKVDFFNLIFYVFTFFSVTHFSVDLIKGAMSRYLTGIYSFCSFIFDQLVHVLLLFTGVIIFFNEYSYYVYDFGFIRYLSIFFVLFLSIFLLFNPSSIIISLFLKSSGVDDGSASVKITKSQVSNYIYGIFQESFVTSNEVDHQAAADKYIERANDFVLISSKGKLDVDISSVSKVNNAGRVIGYVERLILFLFLTLGSVTAVVAILAMKTALRFSDLKDDNDSGKAEYIIIGSFLSLLITVLVSLLARICLSQLGVSVNSFS